MYFSGEILEELKFWKGNVRSFNGQPIRRLPGVAVVWTKKVYSDAVVVMMGGAMFANGKVVRNTVFQSNLSE